MLESYITPIILSYVDKYIKNLKPEDLQLSFWGGDVVLQKLDLRLDVLKKELNLPLSFSNGHIHELRIHVPWTKLGSEPIVITINTIECVLNLGRRSTGVSEQTATESDSEAVAKREKYVHDPDLPPGYVQSVINRISYNIKFVVNNLILKYVEEDIVLSVNVKSAECFSVDSNWQDSFVDLTPTELSLRRICTFSDLTVCLDKRGVSGKIDSYQEPMIYRCSVVSRMLFEYDSVNSKYARCLKFSTYCESLNISISDQQLPMYVRLCQLCIALYYGTIGDDTLQDGSKKSKPQKEDSSTSKVPSKQSNVDLTDPTTPENQNLEEVEGEGWVSWAWSFVPEIVSAEELEGSEVPIKRKKYSDPILSVGFYCRKSRITFKISDGIKEESFFGTLKAAYQPLLCLEIDGSCCEILMKGNPFFNAQIGFSAVRLFGFENCVCDVMDAKKMPQLSDQKEVDSYLVSGDNKFEDKEINFLHHSLFNPNCSENKGEKADFFLNTEEHNAIYTETWVIQKFGAFWLDYLYTMELLQSELNSYSSQTSIWHNELKEISSKHFLFAPAKLKINSNAVHSLNKFIDCANDHEYEPYYKEKPEIVDPERPIPTEEEVAVMEEFIPSRLTHFTFLDLNVIISIADHSPSHSREKTTKAKCEKDKIRKELSTLPAIWLYSKRIDVQYSSPMYARRLVKAVSKMTKPSSNLLHHCCSHTSFKLFSSQMGICDVNSDGTFFSKLIILPPCSMAIYKKNLLLNKYWENPQLVQSETMLEVPTISLALTKAHLILLLKIYSSWYEKEPDLRIFTETTLLKDAFKPSGNVSDGQPLLEITILNFELKYNENSFVTAASGTVGNICLNLLSSGKTLEVMTPVFSGPVKTANLNSIRFYRNSFEKREKQEATSDLINFCLQIPKKQLENVNGAVLLDIQGSALFIDPILHSWIQYHPQTLKHKTPSLIASKSPAKKSSKDSEIVRQDETTEEAREIKTAVFSHRSNEDAISNKILYWAPILQCFILQVNVQCCGIFLLNNHIEFDMKSEQDAIQQFREKQLNENPPSALVICLPKFQIHTPGQTPFSMFQEIPFETSQFQANLGDRQPWNLSCTDLSVYTLLGKEKVHNLIEPMSITSTLKFSLGKQPADLATTNSLGLSIHADFQEVNCKLSKEQVSLLSILVTHNLMLLNKVKDLKDLNKVHSEPPRKKMESGVSTSARSHQAKDNLEELVSTANESTEDQATSLIESAVKPLGTTRAVSISLWIQLSLSKLCIDLYPLSQNTKTGDQILVKTEIEDLSSLFDIQEEFKKISCKIRSMNANHFVRYTGQNWKKGAFDGIILSCSEKITGFSRFSSSKSKDGNYFMSLTLTSALANSVKHKLTGHKERRDEELSQQLKCYVWEVCLNIQPCDVVLWCPTFVKLIDLFKISSPTKLPKSPKSGEQPYTLDTEKTFDASLSLSAYSERSQSKFSSHQSKNKHHLFSQNLPLIYLDLKHARFFLPVANTKIDYQPSHSPGDTFLLHISAISIKPYAENPLSRMVLRKDIYSRAVQANVSLLPGSEVEDRQYQMDVNSMSIRAGCWNQMSVPANDNITVTARAQQLVTGQNPALEWNYSETRKKESAYQLVPIVTSFDLQIVAAPAIILSRNNTLEMPESTVVCGHSVEINITSDMEIFLTPFHIFLAEKSFNTNLALITGNQVDSTEIRSSHSMGKHWKNSTGKTSLADSGVESDASMAEHCSSAIRERYRVIPEINQLGKTNQHRLRLKTKRSLLVPYNILLTAGKVSFLLYSESAAVSFESNSAMNKPQEEKKENEKQSSSVGQSQSITKEEFCRHPFLYVIFSQPHTIVSIEQESQKFELSCYDFNISCCPSEYVLAVNEELPNSAEFTIPLIETSPGDPDPKSGILPSLFTLRMIDFLLDKSANIDLNIGRPVKLNMNLDRIESIQEFINLIGAMRLAPTEKLFSNPESRIHLLVLPEKEQPQSSTSTKIASAFSNLQHAAFKMCQIVVVLATRQTETNPCIIMSISKVDGELNVKCNSKDNVEIIDFNLNIKDLMLKMSYYKRTRPLLSPVSLKAETCLNFFWQNHSYDQFPRIKVNVKSGLVLISFGQEHFLCATAILHHLQEFQKKSPKKANQILKHKTSDDNVPKARFKDQIEEPFIVNSSKDDLRIGNFLYTNCKDDLNKHPHPGEIIFSSGDHRNNGTMSWSYTEPRVLSQVLITPVPFDTTKSHQEITEQVPCTLEFWDEMRDCFTVYKKFYLTESQSYSLELPAIPADHLIEGREELIVAQCWRIALISNESELSQSPNYEDENYSVELEQLVSPMMLAACMRVDSCFIPSLVPTVSIGLHLPVFELRMSNHTQSLGKINPTSLGPFEFDGLTAADQEFMVLTAESSTICSNHWLSQDPKSLTEFSSKIQAQILEYRNLTLQTIIDQFEMEGSLRLRQEGASLAIVDVETDAIFIRIGQSAVHTFNMTNQAWQQLNKRNSEILLFNYYAICNDTQDTLRFGQVDTDEAINLPSRKMHAYSWRTHKSLQEIHVCIDGWSNWKWSDSFSIDCLGSFVRHLSHKGRNATLFITIKQLTALQKQVTISGMYVFVNYLASDLEIQLNKVAYVGSTTMQSKHLLIMGAKSTLPSFLLAEKDITGVRVKLKQEESSLSEQFAISGEMSNTNTLIKILYNGENYHMWCRIYNQDFFGTIKYFIIFSPLFVFQNHFPVDIQMYINTVKIAKQQSQQQQQLQQQHQQQLVIQGKGKQISLLTLEPFVFHYLTFKNSNDKPDISSPRVELSTELLNKFEDDMLKNDFDIEYINCNWEDKLDRVWPYNYLDYSSIIERGYESQNQDLNSRVEKVAIETVDVEVIVTRRQLTPLNSLLVNIIPKCLAINDSKLSLNLLLDDEPSLSMPSGAILTPSFNEKPFKIALINSVNDTNLMKPIQLYNQTSLESTRIPSNSHKLCLLQDSHVHDIIVIEQENEKFQVCPLVIRSQMQHQIQVMTFQESYIIVNESRTNLSVCPFLMNTKVKKNIAAELNDNLLYCLIASNTTQPLTRWTLVNSDLQQTLFSSSDLGYFLKFSHSDQLPSSRGEWSRPVEIAAGKPRQTTCVPLTLAHDMGLGEMSYCTAAYCISINEHSGITYIVIDKEVSPQTTIHNNCSFSLNFGHSVANNSKIVEEQDFLFGVPLIPPMSSMHYVINSKSDSFPEIKNREVTTRFHISKGISEDGTFLWSDAIIINRDSEIKSEIVGVPNLGYLLVSSQAIGVSVHIVVELLSMLPNRKSREETIQSSMSLSLAKKSTEISLFSSQVCLIVVDELANSSVYREIARATFDGIQFSFYPLKSFGQMVRETCIQLAVNNIQVDNQLYISGAFDFVVLFMKQDSKILVSDGVVGLDTNTVVGVAKAAADSALLVVKAVIGSHCFSSASQIQSVTIGLKPVAIYIEDSYVYEIIKLLKSFVPPVPLHLLVDRETSSPYLIPRSVRALSTSFLHPLRLQELVIEPLSLSASVHASLKMFLASDHTPLSFGKFECHHVNTTPRQLIQAITMHYASGALFKAGWVIGSLEIFGSPGGFVRSLGSGVADFFTHPYEGIIRGPSAFIHGVTSGTSSLVRHVSTGTLKSITNFATSIARNMDRLSLDNDHLSRQEELRRQVPERLSEGFKSGLSGLGISLLGAIAGIVDQPIQSIQKVSNIPTSATQKASGVVSGVGKGLVGVVIKPLGGAAELVSRTGQGILHGSGLTQIPKPRFAPFSEKTSTAKNGNLKYIWKMLQSLPNSELLACLNATIITHQGLHRDGCLLLTPEILFMVSLSEDMQQQAFSVSEIDCTPASFDTGVLNIKVKQSVTPSRIERDRQSERIADFVDAIESPFSNEKPAGTSDMSISDHILPFTTPVYGPTYQYQVPPHQRDSFIALFCLAQDKLSGKGFCYHESENVAFGRFKAWHIDVNVFSFFGRICLFYMDL